MIVLARQLLSFVTVSAIATAAFGASDMSRQVAPRTENEFEVASIKRSPDDAKGAGRHSPGVAEPGGRWVASEATLMDVLRGLYPDFSLPGLIVGLPEWASRDQFDIVAKTNGATTPDAMREMARSLIADRFGFRFHVESRELPIYRLVLARDDGNVGPGMRPPEVDCDAYRAARQRGEPIPREMIRFGDRLPCTALVQTNWARFPGRGRITAGSVTVSMIAPLIARQVGRPVHDQTGLSKIFDVELIFRSAPLEPARVAGEEYPMIFDAVREQLGLKLVESRDRVSVMVVDRAEVPQPN